MTNRNLSVKGIVLDEGRVWLRKNERNEWELPGGKPEEGETEEQTVIRELKEELGFDVEVKEKVQSSLYKINESKSVQVVIYLCKLIKKSGDFEYEGEAGKAEFQSFALDDINYLNMPLFYKEAIEKAI